MTLASRTLTLPVMSCPSFAVNACPRLRSAALFGLIAVGLAACSGGGPAAQRDRSAAAEEISTPTHYATALRLAALGRVEARSGADELAAEHFRAAYRHHADAEFLRKYAESAERAHLYAEARDATKRALMHPLAAEDRQRLEGDVVRLDKLVQPGLVRVAVQVRPDTARVVLTQGNVQRTVLGPGQIYLKAGAWGIETSAKGFQSELRTFQVGEGEGEMLAIALHSEETGPALAEVPQGRGEPERKTPIPEVEPEPEPKRQEQWLPAQPRFQFEERSSNFFDNKILIGIAIGVIVMGVLMTMRPMVIHGK